MYAFGGNEYGQLGNGNYNDTNTPVEIKYLSDKKIIKIACGAYHSIALSSYLLF